MIDRHLGLYRKREDQHTGQYQQKSPASWTERLLRRGQGRHIHKDYTLQLHFSEQGAIVALLNSSVVKTMLYGHLPSKGEKDLLVSTTAVKDFVRVPRITAANQAVKQEIIERASEMISLEDKKVSDFVDLSDVFIQKFLEVRVNGRQLVLSGKHKEVRAKIIKKPELVNAALARLYGQEQIAFDGADVSLHTLKNMPVMDLDKAAGLFRQIDELVFSLYFRVDIQSTSFKLPGGVTELCSTNEYYEYVMNGSRM